MRIESKELEELKESNYDIEEMARSFKSKRSIYESFESVLRTYIDSLIQKAVDEGKLEKNAVEIKSRTKSTESFKGKISRDDKCQKYKNPLEDVTDLVGVKILLTSLDDSQFVYELLRAELKEQIDEENSVDKTQELKASRKFGYLGKHLVVSYDPKMLKTELHSQKEEFEGLEGLKAEIQIKTLLQHVWAEIEHKARYKAGEELCADKKRYFDRLAALIEVADDLFKDLIAESERINNEAKELIKEEQKEVLEDEISQGQKELKSARLDSQTLLFYLKDEAVKQKFKALQNESLTIVYDEEPNSISAKFIELLHCVGLNFTKELNLLLSDENLLKILNTYATIHKSLLQKLSVLQILIYAKANGRQRKEIKHKKLVYERISTALDRLLHENT